MQVNIIKVIVVTLLMVTTTVHANKATNNNTCGIDQGKPLTSGRFGPYDYTDPNHQQYRPTVEDYHFTREVETLAGSVNAPTPGGDMFYTLRKFPNHHRALYSMVRYQTENHKWLPIDFTRLYTMECFFRRAHYFKGNDPMIYMLQAIYSYKRKEYEQSEQFYLKSLAIYPESAETNYNLGLLYIDMGKIEAATKQANIAYGLGFPLQGLKRKLAKHNVSLEQE